MMKLGILIIVNFSFKWKNKSVFFMGLLPNENKIIVSQQIVQFFILLKYSIANKSGWPIRYQEQFR